VTRRSPRGTSPTQDEAVRLAQQVATAAEPTEALGAIAELRRHLDALEAKRVDDALEAGRSWRVVGDALGVTRQTAHRKHAPRIAAAARHAEEQSVAGKPLIIIGPARVAVVLARREATVAQSSVVGTEHLLSGLLREREGIAAKTLDALGVTLAKLRHCAQAAADSARGDPETADLTAPDPTAGAPLPLSRRGREALEQSLREAIALGDEYLGVEHLLLALLRDAGSRAVQCLERLQVSPAMVQAELSRRRAGSAGEARSPARSG